MRKAGLAALGLSLGLLGLELSLQLSSLVLSAARSGARSPDGRRLRVLCLGESTTAPTGLRDFSWPAQLESLSRASGGNGVQAINAAIPAINTAVLAGRLAEQLELYRPDAVVAMMGINDHKWFRFAGPPPGGAGPWRRLLGASRIWRSVLFARHELAGAFHWDIAGRIRVPEAALEELLAAGKIDALEKAALNQIAAGRRPSGMLLWRLLREFSRRGQAARGEALLGELKESSLAEDPYLLLAAGMQDVRMGRKARGLARLRRGYRSLPYDCQVGAHLALATGLARAGASRDALALFERDLASCPGHRLLPALGARLAEELAAAGQSGVGEEARRRVLREFSQAQLAHEGATATEANYRAVAGLLRARGIPFFAMQYPRRPVRELMETLRGESGVRFISNEENFREVLAKGRYEDYFVDRFADDFGHCTPAGNRLIAEAAARALREAGLPPAAPRADSGRGDL